MRRNKRTNKYEPPELKPMKKAMVKTTSVNEVQRRLKLVTEDYEGVRLTREGVAVSSTDLPTWRATLSDLPRTGEYIVERFDNSSNVRNLILKVLRIEHEPSQNRNRPSDIYIVVEIMKGNIIRN